MQICPDFLKSKCQLGVYCRLEHPIKQDQVNEHSQHNPGPIRHGRFYTGECRHCHRKGRLATCQVCRKVGYCDNVCRVADLSRHRGHCRADSIKAPFTNPCAPVPRPGPPTDSARYSLPSNHDQDTTSAVSGIRDSTIFDNNHFYAQRSLELMVGMPFQALHQRNWLSVRSNPVDVSKLLCDAFRLRKFDNRRLGGRDTLTFNLGGYADLQAQCNEFVDLCQRNKLLPASMIINLVKGFLKTIMRDQDLDAEEIIKIYDDVRMPLQMRIFAEQVMGYALVPVSDETWADLLKFEQWEWAGNGFEWKVIFGQK